MARPKIHDAGTAEDLLDAVIELLRTGGPDALSVRAVADASGRSVRAVYALFGSMQAMLDAVAERGYHSLADRVDAVPDLGDARHELVAAGALGFRGFVMSEPEVFRLTFERVSSEVLKQERVQLAAYRAHLSLTKRVQAAREAGGIHADRDDQACIFAFHNTCQGLASGELAARPAPDGPGFWPMLRGIEIEQVWWETLGALVHGFSLPPDTLSSRGAIPGHA